MHRDFDPVTLRLFVAVGAARPRGAALLGAYALHPRRPGALRRPGARPSTSITHRTRTFPDTVVEARVHLTPTRLAVDSCEREEYRLFSGFDDDGASLDQETMEKLLLCAWSGADVGRSGTSRPRQTPLVDTTQGVELC